MMNVLGIDIGTSGCKAGMYNTEGDQLAFADRTYDVMFSGNGGAELDSDEVIEKCFEVIKECTSQAGPKSVRALSISSQGEAFTSIGADGKTLCNAMVSSDNRAEPSIDNVTAKVDKDKLYRITGHTVHPIFTLFKLYWLKLNKPDIWRQARYFLCFEDLLQYRLGLEPAISWPLAGRTMMFDVTAHRWSREILDALELSEEKLARPLPSGTVAGSIEKKRCGELGLADGAVVVAGGHDQTCSALGAGVTAEGIAMLATGTVECITPAFQTPVFSDKLKENNLCTYDYVLNDTYTSVAYNLTGGNILKWFADEFGRQESDAEKETGVSRYELLLENMSKSPTDLLVLPYFTASGTPYFDTKTKGAIYGLRLSTKRSDILRALLEGVAFEMRLNMQLLGESGCTINELRAVGGGAKSSEWIQLKSDVLNRKITRLNITEAGCLGAGMLACGAVTGENVETFATKWVKPNEIVYPQPENSRFYSDRYRQYTSFYQSLRSFSHSPEAPL